MISPTLKTEVAKSIFTEIVQRNKTLSAYFKELAISQVGTYKQSLADQGLETQKDMKSLQKDL
jgi:signal-transduction protein with cAMP-binding, CBS, and nucleotidyltransferase domain